MSSELHQRAAAASPEEQEPLNPPPTDFSRRKTRDPRFDMDIKGRVPWGSIALALFLLSLGTACFIVAYLIHQKHTAGETQQMLSFLAVGFLTFLPGYFESRNAYYAFRKAKGYSFDQIPQF